jgi:hypothetical protein
MGDVKVTILHAGLSTGSSTIDLTSADITSTPTAVLLRFGYGTTNAKYNNNMQQGYGMYDGTKQMAMCWGSSNAQANSDTECGQRNDCAVILYNPSGTIRARRTCSFLSNGIRLTSVGTQLTFLQVQVVIFHGADVEAHVNTFDLNGKTSPEPYTTPGFKPDMIFGMYNGDGGMNTHQYGGQYELRCGREPQRIRLHRTGQLRLLLV